MMKDFDEILGMIIHSCNRYFYSGAKDIKETVVECVTQIYIEQIKADNENE